MSAQHARSKFLTPIAVFAKLQGSIGAATLLKMHGISGPAGGGRPAAGPINKTVRDGKE